MAADDAVNNEIALREAQGRLQLQDQHANESLNELRICLAALERARTDRDQARQGSIQHFRTIAGLRTDIANMRDQHTHRQATWATKAAGFELRLRERT